MRLMWLWVLLYALVAGFILLFWTISIWWGLDMNPPSGIAYDIGHIAGGVSMGAVLGGFVVCLMGMIFLLIRGTFAAGRAMSLTGIGLYNLAALGIVVLGAMSGGSPWDIVGPIVVIVVLVVLPGFFIMRELRRAQKAENIET